MTPDQGAETGEFAAVDPAELAELRAAESVADAAVAGESERGRQPEPAAARRAAARPRVMLIVNPIATTVSEGKTAQVRRALERSYAVDLRVTDGRGHATELAREAVASGVDLVAVYAGDGTTNEAIQALAGTETALAHLPGGNASVLARIVGMGHDGPAAAERVAASGGRVRRIDLGDVNGRPFSFTAGIGLDAAVVRLVDSDLERKHRFRWTAFWLEAVRVARDEYFGAEACLTVEAGGRSVRAVTSIVQNAQAYTFAGPRPLTVGTDVSLESHTLQATALLAGLRWIDVPALTYRTLAPVRADGHARIETLPAVPELVVRCDRPMPIQLDGDFWMELTEARFSVRPSALSIVM